MTESSAQAAEGAAVRPAPAAPAAAGTVSIEGAAGDGGAGGIGTDGGRADVVAPRTAPDADPPEADPAADPAGESAGEPAALLTLPAGSPAPELESDARSDPLPSQESGPEADPAEALGLDGEDSPAGLTTGIWWCAVLLPFLSVAGAVLCFAAGVLNTGGCRPQGSALCSGGGQWFTFVLPLLVAPLTAGVTAIGAVTFRRHRSTWLAVGYAVLFISLLLGLASANSGSS